MKSKRAFSRLFSQALGLWLMLGGGEAIARDRYTEDWDDQREALSTRGVAFQLSYTGSFMDHLHGGFRRGANWQGLLDLAMLVDLEKVAGWRGAILHAEGIWVQGPSASSMAYIGNINEVSNIQGLAATARAYHVWLQQRLWADKLRFTIGWMTLDTDFMISPSANLFINSALGPIQTWNINFATPVYPLAAPGFLAEWQVDERHELQLGVYDGNTGGERGNRRSSNTRLGTDDGAAILLEGARSHEIAGRAGTVKLGTGWNTGLTTQNATGDLVHGNGHFYAMLDQTLVPGRDKDAPDRLTFFTRIGRVIHPGRSMVDFALDVGVTGSGLRPADQWGLMMMSSRFSRSFVNATLAGGGSSSNRETTLELTYKAQFNPHLALQPTLQHIIDPQGGSPDATVLGLVLMLTF